MYAQEQSPGTERTLILPPAKATVVETRVCSHTYLMTPADALILESESMPEFQRPLNRANVDNFKQFIRTERFHPTVITMACCDGQRSVLDGQHRIRAIIESGVAQVVVIVTHACSLAEEVRRLYVRLRAGKPMTFADIMNALGVSASTHIAAGYLASINRAAYLIENDFEKSRTGRIHADMEEGEGRIVRWGNEAIRYLECAHGRGVITNAMRNSSCMSIGLVTMRYHLNKAEPFWKSVAADNMLASNSPEKKLADFLRDTRVRKIGDDLFIRNIAAAWNAYFEGRTLLALRARPLDLKIRIAGTHWSG